MVMTKRRVLAAVAGAVAAVAIPVSAQADTGDNHVPDMDCGSCPGGEAIPGGGEHHCLGKPYPDGSQWLQGLPVPFPAPSVRQTPRGKSRFKCVVIPTPSVVVIAPPGGCLRR
jgi:hypothetical protein